MTITGGKLTTWRRMAKLAVDRIVEREGREAPCRTHEIPLGQPEDPDALPDVPAVDAESREHLAAPLRPRRAQFVLRLAGGGAAAGPADQPRAAGHRRRGRLRRRARAGARARRRAAAAHPARAARRPQADRAELRGARARGARRWAASSAGTRPAWRRARRLAGAGAPRGARAARQPAGRGGSAARGAACETARRSRSCLSAPVLMGIVNATPDSFSDRQGPKPLDELVGERHGAGRAGRGDRRRGRRVGPHRPPGRARPRRRAARVVPLVERLAADGGRCLGRHLARAGGARGARGRARDGQRRERTERRRGGARVRRGGAALVITHTRVPPKTKAFPAYDDVVAEVDGPPRRARGAAPARGVGRGPDRARPGHRPRQDARAVDRAAAPLPRLAERGLPLLLAVSRKDFVGALTGRAPAERDAGHAGRRRARPSRGGAAILRVHDVAGARDYLRVRAALGGGGRDAELELAESSAGRRYEHRSRSPSSPTSIAARPTSCRACSTGRWSRSTSCEPDVVIVSGDLTGDGLRGEYQLAADYLDADRVRAHDRDPRQPRLAQRRLRPLRGADGRAPRRCSTTRASRSWPSTPPSPTSTTA